MKNPRISPELSGLFLPFVLALATGCSGEPAEKTPEDPKNPWNGNTYLLDIAARNWAEPRGIGTEIDEFVPNFLIRVEGEAPEAFSVMMGTADASGVQDGCNPTRVIDATASPPGVTIGPSEFPLHIQHVTEPTIAVDAIIYDLTLTDILPDGDTLSRTGELSGTMDFRQLYRLFTLLVNPTPESVCTTLEMTYGSPCAPCPSDDEPFCLTVKANTLGATPSDAMLEPIDGVDPSCTPTPE